MNVVVILREGETIVAPKATETVYPGDSLLCFATDAYIERFKTALGPVHPAAEKDLESYALRRVELSGTSPLAGKEIRSSGIRETYDCIVVGLERDERRIPSPSSETSLAGGDVLWVVGEAQRIDALVSAHPA